MASHAAGRTRPSGGRRGMAATTAAALPPLLLLLLAAATVPVAAQLPPVSGDWKIITGPQEAELTIVGPPQQPFPRPPPRTLEPQLLSDFSAQFNLLQDVSAEGGNMFTETSPQYVATVHGAFIEGEGGLVYDPSGRVYHLPHMFFTRTSPLLPMPQRTVAQAQASCEPLGAAASVVQKYGHMYYHFVAETLPRVALLMKTGRLTSNVKLLTWGQPYEYQYLEMLGVSRSQVVPYNASKVYCADRLLVPTPTPRITPPRESLLLVRQGLGVKTLPEAQRDLVIYVSRQGEASRRVSNEKQLLAAIRSAFPKEQVVVFSGDLPARSTIELFQRAKLVLGPHGAGLSHILFSAPGTAVLEFLFMADPPLMFWHTAAALGQQYWLLPVPQAYWMQEEMQVPTAEVVDILTAVLQPHPKPNSACQPGTYSSIVRGSSRCTACSAGSYAFNDGSSACQPCAAGRAAASIGSSACRTCQPGTYSSADGKQCVACPQGTFSMLPGAWQVQQCLTAEQRRSQQEDQAKSVQLLSKLSPVFADQRRRLIEQTGSATMSQSDLCAAQKLAGSSGDAYAGPYMLRANGASLANCTDVVAPVPSVPAYPELPAMVVAQSPPMLVLPPVLVPTLPPALLPPAVPAAPEPEPRTPITTLSDVPPSEAPRMYPKKKKVVDDYVIILSCLLGGLLVLPLLAFIIRRAYLARQHRLAHAGAAGAPMMPGTASLRAYHNPAFQGPAEDAASTGSGARDSLM